MNAWNPDHGAGLPLRRLHRPILAMAAVIVLSNVLVQFVINDWLTWMRPQLIETWTNYQFMRELMWPRYEESGLPEARLVGERVPPAGCFDPSVSLTSIHADSITGCRPPETLSQ